MLSITIFAVSDRKVGGDGGQEVERLVDLKVHVRPLHHLSPPPGCVRCSVSSAHPHQTKYAPYTVTAQAASEAAVSARRKGAWLRSRAPAAALSP